jgi:methyl-accepting chemotaxis protein
MRWTIVRKLVLGITCVSMVTYGTSAFFIFVLKPYLAPQMPDLWYVIGVLALGVFWTGFLGWLAALQLVRPLRRLTKVMNVAAGGDLRVEIPDYRSNDEIGELTVSFRTMVGSLRDTIKDVAYSVKLTSNQADALNEAIQQAAAGTETIREVTDSISHGASRQAASTVVALKSVEHVASSASSVQECAATAMNTADRLRETTEESMQAIRALIGGLTEIVSSNREAIGEINQLKQLADEVGNISSMVQEIAGQTQLLALNATIEAAHAGDQGLGFGVVAAEVRKLSEQTSEAAGHIEQLIRSMQQGVREVVRRIEADAALAETEVVRGEQASGALKVIGEAVRESAAAVGVIVEGAVAQASDVKEALNETQDIAVAAARIGDGAKQAADAVESQLSIMQEIAASAEELRSYGEKLQAKIGKFIIN